MKWPNSSLRDSILLRLPWAYSASAPGRHSRRFVTIHRLRPRTPRQVELLQGALDLGGWSVGLSDKGLPGHRRTGGMQDNAPLLYIHSGFRVGSDSRRQSLAKPRFKVEQLVEARPKLRVNSAPGDRRLLRNRMQSPGKPHIDIKGYGPIPQLPDRRFQKRDRMIPKCLVEHRV